LSRKQVCRKAPRVRIPPPPPIYSVRIVLMDIAKKLALGLLSPLFIFLLFATAFDIGFVRTATHPTTVKRLISESGVYDSLVPSALAQNKTITTSLGNISTADPAVQKAATQAISSQYVRQRTEAAIDNVYQWLDGGISQPNFKIDLSGAKGSFADSVAGSVQQRLAGLPACSAVQNLAIAQSGQFDAVNATCLPSGVTAQAAAEQVKASLNNSQDFLKDANVSAADIKSSDSSQSVFNDQLKNLPKLYRQAKRTPLILSILTILTGAGIVFLSRTWQRGLRHIGINLAVIGVIMMIFSYGLNRAVSTKVVPKIKVDNAVLQQDVRKLVSDLSQQIDKNYWFFGGFYTVLGAGGITAAEISRRRSKLGPVAELPAAAIEK
jgi:uncharacterized protein YjeT (DUF2065 family)